MSFCESSDASWVFINEVEIEATCKQAFFYLCDAASWPKFFPNMSELKWTSDDPKRVGTTRTVVVSGIVIDEQFLVWEDDKRYAFRFVKMSNPLLFLAGIEDYVLEGL